jgi:hypothetical protein
MIHFQCKNNDCRALLIDGFSPTSLLDILHATGYGEVTCYKCCTKYLVPHGFMAGDVYTEAEFIDKAKAAGEK